MQRDYFPLYRTKQIASYAHILSEKKNAKNYLVRSSIDLIYVEKLIMTSVLGILFTSSKDDKFSSNQHDIEMNSEAKKEHFPPSLPNI